MIVNRLDMTELIPVSCLLIKIMNLNYHRPRMLYWKLTLKKRKAHALLNLKILTLARSKRSKDIICLSRFGTDRMISFQG